MATCSTPCPSGSCPNGQMCYQATNCHIPLIRLQSNLLVTMMGPDRVMEGGDNDVFGGTMNDIIGETAGELGIKLGGVDVGEQKVALGRRLRYMDEDVWGERRLERKITNITHRLLPSGSSALDVSMVVTGDYR